MATLAEQKEQQRTQWSASAPAWEKHFTWLESQLGALTVRLLDSARVGRGTRVLDLACGSGEPSVAAAKRGAQVVATDYSPQMVESTRRRAASSGVTLEMRVMDIENMDVADASFEVVTCRFGLMFCPDPQRAARELHRVLQPGGRFALSVWDEPAKNPFFTAMGQLMQKLTSSPPPDPKAPGPFRLAPASELESTLRAGGFTDITIESMPITFTWPSPEDYWAIQSELSAPVKAAVAALPADEVAKVRAAVLDLAAANVVGGKVQFAAQPLLAFGTR